MVSAATSPPLPSWEKERRKKVLLFALLGVLAFAIAYFLPWWNFHMKAPQYPQGLELVIALDGVTGDTFEINIINHYIGMGHLDEAAELERALGGWLVAGLGLAVTSAILLAGKKLNWLATVMAVGFPLGFIADTMYWMYTFGHDLDPKAPVHIKAFTPTLFGDGKVGQFYTTATPAIGFWVAVVGVVLVAIASRQRVKVCAVCPQSANCSGTCGSQLVRVP